MQRFLALLLPLVVFALFFVIFIAGIVVFTYIMLFAFLLGAVVFLVAWVRDRFFPRKSIRKQNPEKPGRIIDHE